MIEMPSWQNMRKYCNDNIDRYMQEHPGEFILLTPTNEGEINERFFEKREDLESSVIEYENIRKIPKPFYEIIPLCKCELEPTEREKRLVQEIFDGERRSMELGKWDIIGIAVR